MTYSLNLFPLYLKTGLLAEESTNVCTFSLSFSFSFLVDCPFTMVKKTTRLNRANKKYLMTLHIDNVFLLYKKLAAARLYEIFFLIIFEIYFLITSRLLLALAALQLSTDVSSTNKAREISNEIIKNKLIGFSVYYRKSTYIIYLFQTIWVLYLDVDNHS